MFTSKRQADDEFAAFVAESTASLSSTAWLLTGNREAASELLQQALVKTYLAWKRVRRDDAPAYCRRVMANQNIDNHRKHRDLPIPDYGERAQPRSPFQVVDDRDELVRLLAQLPAQQRTVIVLRYFDDLAEQDVANELNISLGAVKSACSRGLATLRTLSGRATDTQTMEQGARA
ncbi:SigE family RNA polymerase sigma factor [Aestuariimicrobium ganziense]|uniref:SigE family RNA polymerase sigma factor n=1 Tax=Aestuariimicrobium ganziense TaxID=2773677 RepID=UPI0019430A4F|nr:SigE family RNA polymerase sigma factor [Aestuariimicrobium ganziense]